MPPNVYCKRLKREAEGLSDAPLFGKVGKEILANVSAEAWAEWEEMQLKIVNEYHLDLADKDARKTLTTQMRAFLGLDGDDDAPGVLEVGTPPSEDAGG